MVTFSLILSCWIIYFQSIVLSVKIGSYNTYQIFTNPFANKLLPKQVPQVGQSNVDVFCLQELNLVPNILGYTAALKQFGYTHSFSILDVDPKAPTTPCTGQELAAANSTCSRTYCANFYDGSPAFGVCVATVCPDDYDAVIFTECGGCIGLFGGIQPQLGGAYPLSLAGALSFCSAPPPPFDKFVFSVIDGLVITSKTEFPIINKWSYDIPSWLFLPRRLQIAEIDICSETKPNDAECTDSIIVGCTHLEATAFVKDSGIVQNKRVEDNTVTSHVGLNRYQTQYLLDNYYNDDLLKTLGIEDNAENIYGVFLMGDINTGQLFNRCDWKNSPADNCEGVVPSNPFDLFAKAKLIDAPDIRYKGKVNPDVECTVCKDPKSADYNPLTLGSDMFIQDADSSRDLDHILIQDGYCKNFKAVAFEREFMDSIVDGSDIVGNNILVPTSDHYGVSLNIEFKGGNKGGRKNKRNCRERKRPRPKRRRRGPKRAKKSASTSVSIQIDKNAIYVIMGIVIFLLALNIICLSKHIGCCKETKGAAYSKVNQLESDDEVIERLKN